MSHSCTLFLEHRSGELRLADDRQERAASNFAVVRYGHRDRRGLDVALHHYVAATLADLDEAMLGEDAADGTP